MSALAMNPAPGVKFVLGIAKKAGKQVSQVQSVVFDKLNWTMAAAKKWLRQQGFSGVRGEQAATYWRFRQKSPSKFKRFATVTPGKKNPALKYFLLYGYTKSKRGAGSPDWTERGNYASTKEAIEWAKQATDANGGVAYLYRDTTKIAVVKADKRNPEWSPESGEPWPGLRGQGHVHILHTGTLSMVPYNFKTREEAQRWLDSYGVSQEYKDTYYRIVEDKGNPSYAYTVPVFRVGHSGPAHDLSAHAGTVVSRAGLFHNLPAALQLAQKLHDEGNSLAGVIGGFYNGTRAYVVVLDAYRAAQQLQAERVPVEQETATRTHNPEYKEVGDYEFVGGVRVGLGHRGQILWASNWEKLWKLAAVGDPRLRQQSYGPSTYGDTSLFLVSRENPSETGHLIGAYQEHLGMTTDPEFQSAMPDEQAAAMTAFDAKENPRPIAVGDKVKYRSEFLRSIGAYTGPMGHARGIVTALIDQGGGWVLAAINWRDQGELPDRVNVRNLIQAGVPNPLGNPATTSPVVAEIYRQLKHAGLGVSRLTFVQMDPNTLKVSKGENGSIIHYDAARDVYDVTEYHGFDKLPTQRGLFVADLFGAIMPSFTPREGYGSERRGNPVLHGFRVYDTRDHRHYGGLFETKEEAESYAVYIGIHPDFLRLIPATAERYDRSSSGGRYPGTWRPENENPQVGSVNAGRWAQEHYDSASGDARKRAAQLRKLGYRVTVSSLGSQVTQYGSLKLTMVDIRPGSNADTEDLPPLPAGVAKVNPAGGESSWPAEWKARIETLLRDWHEAGRAAFERSYSNLNYDTYATKTVDYKIKWALLNEGGGPHRSGAFMLDRETGNIYGIKAWGVPNRRKLIGHMDTLSGQDLLRGRWGVLLSRSNPVRSSGYLWAVQVWQDRLNQWSSESWYKTREQAVREAKKRSKDGKRYRVMQKNTGEVAGTFSGGKASQFQAPQAPRWTNPSQYDSQHPDLGQAAFDAGKDWRLSGAYDESGVANARVVHYGFLKWYNSLSPAAAKGHKKKTLEGNFREGWNAGKRIERKQNPEDAAAALSESFHGRDPETITTFEEEEHEHEWYAGLGDLVELKVRTVSGLDATVEFPEGKSRPVLASSEDGRQLYIVGGDQTLDLDSLKMSGEKWERDLMTIGEITEVTYRTEKGFDSFKPTDYFHHFSEEDKRHPKPTLLYDARSKALKIAGGGYKVEAPGIIN